MHFGELHFEQLAEERSDVDAGKKIARAAGTLGRAGVVTELVVVEREIHERGHREGTALPNQIGDQSFLIGTKISFSPRHTRSCARRPAWTFCNSRAASTALDTGLLLTVRITSPGASAPADGPS